jgi:hypothetical protein
VVTTPSAVDLAIDAAGVVVPLKTAEPLKYIFPEPGLLNRFIPDK